ncbi:MAG: N-acetyl sugar amidotransferase [Candidatus Heimdallarchaeota archaeon]
MTTANERAYQICTRCVMDTSDPQISFDDQGICNHCHSYERKAKKLLKTGNEAELQSIVENIKKHGRDKQYDCVLGISGGVDSSYAAYVAHLLGLRVLLVHFDNGWDSELAVNNIENISKKLDFDLYTHVVDWEEFKDLQLAYLWASVVDIEVASDHAIRATVLNVARDMKIKYLLGGNNVVTEGIAVAAWDWRKNDLRNLKSIHKRFGHKRLETYPMAGYGKITYYEKIKRMKRFFPLNYVRYVRNEAKEALKKEVGWKDYGGKHYESRWTHFYQSYVLPEKFGIDKRRMHLSTLINSNQITRIMALTELEKPLYDPKQLEYDKEYVLKKFELSEEDFRKIMNLPIVPHQNYGTDNLVRIPIRILETLVNPRSFKEQFQRFRKR